MKKLDEADLLRVAGGGSIPFSMPIPGGGSIYPTGGVTHPGPGGNGWVGIGISFPC